MKRGRKVLEDFSQNVSRSISGWFAENESGAIPKRPELFRLLDIVQQGDILLVEQVDRISRLNAQDWELLKAIITTKGIAIVALDLPTSYQFMKMDTDNFTKRMLVAINSMMLDMLAAVARKDYEDRRSRQAKRIEKAKKIGNYKKQRINHNLHENIIALLKAGKSYNGIVSLLGCSKSTISKIAKSNPKP